MASEKFCLRWNDFERNISSAFKDIRDEKEFFDVTIACEDEQLQAHKVILSACSPFFRSVLRRNQPSSQQGALVLYLKGVTHRDMESVLNFMYHGEVNVAQDDLNSFLAVAEELRVKGLTQSNSGSAAPPPSKPAPPAPRRRPSDEPGQHAPPPPKRPRPPPPVARAPAPQDDDEVQEYVPVKAEPMAAAPQQQQYEEPGGGMVMTTEDSMQYDENYGAYEEEGYDEGGYYQGQEGQEGQEASAGKVYCRDCDKHISGPKYARHLRDVHTANNEVACNMCTKVFKNENSYKYHLRNSHGIYQNK